MWRVYFKGMAMGAADIVPGVSGGTIAFISGIYERLINALAQFSPGLITVFKEQGFRGVWQAVDGQFLLILFTGILTSIFTLAKVISFLLSSYPSMVWGFFLGLVAGSIWFVLSAIRHISMSIVIYIALGATISYLVTSFSPTLLEPTHINLFLSGAVAICAMILPGVSGSFLLLLLGMYTPVIAAIKNLEMVTLSVFATGCAVGLVLFTHVLRWLLKKYHDITMAVLTGFLIGALNKIWPWKHTIEYRFNPQGEDVPTVQANLFPMDYEALTGQPSYWPWVILLAVCGLFMVIFLERLGTGSHNSKF